MKSFTAFVSFLVVLLVCFGDHSTFVRATPPPERSTASSSFSYQEQALFGHSHAEDCIFGSPSTTFRFPPDEQGHADMDNEQQVRNVNSKTASDQQNSVGFGTPPSFRRR